MGSFNQPLGGNEMARFGGPATMMRLPSQSTAHDRLNFGDLTVSVC
jgi:guanidinobutyrase